MIISFFRTIILYATVIIALRLMGKRQIGEMQPSELVVAIMISDLASIPMGQVGTPLLSGVLPIATLVAAELLLSYLTLKNKKIRHIISGQPSVLISGGVINEIEMERLHLNIEDLMEQLRVGNIFNITDVEYAILETNGQISIIPKSDKAPLTPSDMKLKMPDAGIPLTLITDGKTNYKNLGISNFSEKRLMNELKKRKIKSPENVFFAVLESNGTLFIQEKRR